MLFVVAGLRLRPIIDSFHPARKAAAPSCTPHHLQHRPTCGCAVTEKPREQAHLPAQQPASRQDPWVPPAHAHPRRPRHPGSASP